MGFISLEKITWHIVHTPWSYVHNSIAVCEFKLELSSRNTEIGTKLHIFCPCDYKTLVDDPKKRYGISATPLKAFCVISQPSVNSNVQEIPKL